MADPLISLLITAIILAIIFGIIWAIIRVIPWPAPFGQIVTYLFYGVVAIVVILKILVPLIGMV